VNEMAVTDFTTEDGELTMIEIRLNPVMRFESKVYKFTLLHEMVHVKLYPYRFHGKKFDQEMLRLACAGAFNSIW
jgi:predicted SprT family Zn-dependent metalloprotease